MWPAAASPQTVLGNSEGLVSRAERKELDLQALFEAKGFEPSTFCMASSSCDPPPARIFPANARVLGWGCRFVIPRLSP